jgi:hypothetical protein
LCRATCRRGGHLQESVHDTDQENAPSDPNMGRTVLGGRTSLLETLMVEEAEAELAEDEDGYNNANDLVKVAEATGLEGISVRDGNDDKNSTLNVPADT